MKMILTINLYNFRYQIYKAREGCAVYLEVVFEYPQRKTYKLLDSVRGDSQQPHHRFHYENRLTCLQQNLLLRRMLIESTHFSSGLSSDSNSLTNDSELHSVFRWVLFKNRNHQPKKTMIRLHEFVSNTFHQINFHNEKGWSTKLIG